MGKTILVAVFALAMCWGIAKYVNLSATAFSLAGVSINWTMIVMVIMVAIGYRLVK